MGYLVCNTYRIRSQCVEEFTATISEMAQLGEDLGASYFEVWQDDDEPLRYVEMMGFESWSHYQRLSQIPWSNRMQDLMKVLDRCIEGGLDAMETWNLKSVV